MQALFQLTGLRLLAVRASGLRDLTAQISALSELRRLDVSRSRDLEVHENIPWASMTSLRSLDLSECRHLRVSALRSVPSCCYAVHCLLPTEGGLGSRVNWGPTARLGCFGNCMHCTHSVSRAIRQHKQSMCITLMQAALRPSRCRFLGVNVVSGLPLCRVGFRDHPSCAGCAGAIQHLCPLLQTLAISWKI